MVLEGLSAWHGGAQSDALVTSLHLLALPCFASYCMQRLVEGASTRAYLFSVCSARLLSAPLVGYTVGCWQRYDDVQKIL